MIAHSFLIENFLWLAAMAEVKATVKVEDEGEVDLTCKRNCVQSFVCISQSLKCINIVIRSAYHAPFEYFRYKIHSNIFVGFKQKKLFKTNPR